MPTLLEKGNLVEVKGGPKQDELDKLVPIKYIIDKIAAMLKKNTSIDDRLMVLLSSTGSGKSTVFPAELYHTFFAKNPKNIVSTQPRVFNAVRLPDQIIPYNNKEAYKKYGLEGREPLVLGENIGYQTKPFVRKPNKGILFITIGSLLAQLLNMTDDAICDSYSFIIVDEAHENSIDATMMHYFLRELLRRCHTRPDCPLVVITSATFDPYRFAKYYGGTNRAVVDVLGLTFPVKMNFIDYDSSNYINSVVDIVAKIHKERPEEFLGKKEESEYRDILVFVGGQSEIMGISKGISELHTKDKFFEEYPLATVELSGKTVTEGGEEYEKVFMHVELIKADGKKAFRKVIIATNVGETGITYPYLKYVIDTGFYKSMEYSPDFGISFLLKKPLSKDVIHQRKGRVGRLAPGELFCVYKKSTYEMLNDNKIAQFYTDDVTGTILDLIKLQMDSANLLASVTMRDLLDLNIHYSVKDVYEANVKFDISAIDLIDKVSNSHLQYSLYKLYTLGFIDTNSKLTTVGICSFKFHMCSVEQVKIILSAYIWGVSVDDMILAAATMYKRDSALYDHGGHRRYISNNPTLHKLNKLLNCDYLIYPMLVSMIDFSDVKNIKKQCEEIGINYEGLMESLEWRDGIINSLNTLGLNPYNFDDKINMEIITKSGNIDTSDVIEYIKKSKHCLYEGLKLNVAVRKGEGKYVTVETDVFLRDKNTCDGTYVMYDTLTAGFGPIKINKGSVLDGYVNL